MDRTVRSGRPLATLALWLSACCPPPDPQDPASGAPPPTIATRTIPPAIVSRFERPGASAVTAEQRRIEREPLDEPPPVPLAPKTEAPPGPRETLSPPAPPAPRARLPEDVVLRLLEAGRTVFTRCFKRAIDAEPLVRSFKVHVIVEVDGSGAVTSSRADTPDAALAACLSKAAGWLQYPATGSLVAVDLPLLYVE